MAATRQCRPCPETTPRARGDQRDQAARRSGVLPDRGPFLLGERHRSQRDNLLLLVVEVRLQHLVEVVPRCRQRLTGLHCGVLAPRGARGARAAESCLDDLMLVRDLVRHRRLLRYALEKERVEQEVLARMMVMQHLQGEIDVVSHERHPTRRRCRPSPHQLPRLFVGTAEGAMHDRHVTHIDRLRARHRKSLSGPELPLVVIVPATPLPYPAGGRKAGARQAQTSRSPEPAARPWPP